VTSGKNTENTLPESGELSTVMSPPASLATPSAIDKPSPVPLPRSLVVKKGSNTRNRVLSVMPLPSSFTVTRTNAPGWASAPAAARATLTSTLPPRGDASRAFDTKFKSSCCSSLGSIDVV